MSLKTSPGTGDGDGLNLAQHAEGASHIRQATLTDIRVAEDPRIAPMCGSLIFKAGNVTSNAVNDNTSISLVFTDLPSHHRNRSHKDVAYIDEAKPIGVSGNVEAELTKSDTAKNDDAGSGAFVDDHLYKYGSNPFSPLPQLRFQLLHVCAPLNRPISSRVDHSGGETTLNKFLPASRVGVLGRIGAVWYDLLCQAPIVSEPLGNAGVTE
ncbi:hypothetical protein BDY19DRAFT_903314 [Irpex rosettiformis]|uniref:Uncharacterized protein n=1 Tax=Irpex rosettiformis TaxID=378272 RepID=A0ACB8UE02_9APHY|nr:hypothetical protein BDY19DRAFT_903314 [Irpex rosettiformis]